MLILELWGISFHAVVVFGLGKDLLFKSVLGRCGLQRSIFQTFWKVHCCTKSMFYEEKERGS